MLSGIVLNNLLNKEQRQHGLQLAETEDFVTLYRNGESIAIWSSQGVKIEEIQGEANKYLTGDVIPQVVDCGGVSFK